MSSGEITGRLEECSAHQAPTFSRLIEAEESRRPTRTYLADFIISHMVPAALDWREFAAGWGASFVNITITFPMNKLMFRQMLHGVDFHRAARMLKKEGLCRLYRGIAPPLFQKTLSGSIMWGMFDTMHRFLVAHPGHGLGLHGRELVAAMAAGSMEAVLTPFERVQVLLQDKRYHNKFRNTASAFHALRVYGIREYYRGLVPILLRNGPSNCLFFPLRRETKELVHPGSTWYGNLAFDFINGAVIGAFISTVFYPVNVVKTRIQAQVGGEFRGFVETFMEIYRERGSSWRKMYIGIHVNYTRALVSWGIINASYEVFKNALKGEGDLFL